MTRVVHCKKEKCDVYIGRGSIFGNPFIIGPNGTREECIIQYEAWIRSLMKEYNTFTKEEILKLKGKTLGCWCYPKACHGDVLIKLIEEFS